MKVIAEGEAEGAEPALAHLRFRPSPFLAACHMPLGNKQSLFIHKDSPPGSIPVSATSSINYGNVGKLEVRLPQLWLLDTMPAACPTC